jgi:hypothetical protein
LGSEDVGEKAVGENAATAAAGYFSDVYWGWGGGCSYWNCCWGFGEAGEDPGDIDVALT